MDSCPHPAALPLYRLSEDVQRACGHPGSNCNPPDTSYPDNPARNPCGTDPNGTRSYTTNNAFYFTRILDVRAAMEQNGEGGKKMWLTETGWDSSANPPDAYKYARSVSEQQQGQYLTRAFDLEKSYPWMDVMFVWNLNFQVTTSGPSDEKYGWGVVNSQLEAWGVKRLHARTHEGLALQGIGLLVRSPLRQRRRAITV